MKTGLLGIIALACLVCGAVETDSLKPFEFLRPVPPHLDDKVREFQSAPSLTVSPGGRLWAAWHTGGKTESEDNAVLVATSGDGGKTWSKPVFAIDPAGPLRPLDPGFWTGPDGKVRLFFGQLYGMWDGRCGVFEAIAEDPEREDTAWTTPRRLCDGFMKNKPVVLRDGRWLYCSEFQESPETLAGSLDDLRPLAPEFSHPTPLGHRANVFASSDRGRTVTPLGFAQAADPRDRDHPENMVVERRDGSLWMLVRMRYGIGESESRDGGKTWTPIKPAPFKNPNSRFFIGRLKSGALLLVKNGPLEKKTGRDFITAFVSDDDGKTWLGGLVLDGRRGVSYPDAVEDARGFIHVINDHDRQGDCDIVHHMFTEADVRAGKLVTSGSRLGDLVNKADGAKRMTAMARRLLVPSPAAMRFPNACREVKFAKAPGGWDSISMLRQRRLFGLSFSRSGWVPHGLFAPRLPRSTNTVVSVRFSQTRPNQLEMVRLTCAATDGRQKVLERKCRFPWEGPVSVKFDLGATGVPDVDAKTVGKPRPWAVIGVSALTVLEAADDLLYFDGLDAAVETPAAEAIELELDTGTAHHAVAKGRKTVTAELVNVLAVPFSGSATLTVAGADGTQVGEARKFAFLLPPGGKKEIELPVPAAFGVYEVNLKTEADGVAAMRRRSFAHVETGVRKPSKDGDFELGSVAHLNPYVGYEREIGNVAEAMSAAGLNILRTDFRIPTEKEYALYDCIIDEFGRRGLAFDLILDYAADREGKIDIAKTIENWRKYFVRYRGKVRYWEALNEPDMDWGRKYPPSAAEYSELCRQAKIALRECDPDAKLMSAGFCMFKHPIMGTFQKDTMRTAKDFVDLHCFHGHGDADWYGAMIAGDFLPLRNELGISVPWYANETALTSMKKDTPMVQSAAYWKKAILSQALGARGHVWYNMREKGFNPTDGEHHYGMFTLDFYPKPVYAAADAMTRLLRGREYVRQLPCGVRNHAHLYRGDGEETLVVWRTQWMQKGSPTAELRFRVDGGEAEIVDIFGNRRPLKAENGIVTVTAEAEPCAINVRGGRISVP